MDNSYILPTKRPVSFTEDWALHELYLGGASLGATECFRRHAGLAVKDPAKITAI